MYLLSDREGTYGSFGCVSVSTLSRYATGIRFTGTTNLGLLCIVEISPEDAHPEIAELLDEIFKEWNLVVFSALERHFQWTE